MCMPFLTDKGIEVNMDALWESGGLVCAWRYIHSFKKIALLNQQHSASAGKVGWKFWLKNICSDPGVTKFHDLPNYQ